MITSTKEMPAIILDVTCGARTFWFNKHHPRTIYTDFRRESSEAKDKSSKNGYRTITVAPDLQANFTQLPFHSCSFALVIFDPPHLIHNGTTSWLKKKYGKLDKDWRNDLKAGFSECFRVLRPEGILVFKWSEVDIRLSEILRLTPVKPLIGHRSGKALKTHWILFMKEPDEYPM